MMNGAVYQVLAEHQISDHWEFRELARQLHRWAETFDFEFKLKIAQIALTIDSLRPTRLGHFRKGHNGFGLEREIATDGTCCTASRGKCLGHFYTSFYMRGRRRMENLARITITTVSFGAKRKNLG